MARELDPAFSHYVRLADAVPKLSREEELVLAQRWLKKKDPAAADALVRAHLRYVVAIARSYSRYGVPLAELVAEGNFGIVHALRKFDPARGNRFVTYAAYWIRAYVLAYVIHSWSLVGVGSGALRSKMFFSLRRERARVMSLVGDPERADELLAKKFGVEPEKIATMVRRLENRDVSLDTKVFHDASTSLVDTMESPDPDQESSFAAGETRDELRLAVRGAVADLDPRERLIVEKRTMVDAEDALSLAELGRRMGVSRERVRQLEERAKRKLRQSIGDFSRASPKLDVVTAA